MSVRGTTRLKYLTTVSPKVRRVADGELVSFIPMEAVSESGGLEASRTRPAGEVRTGYTGFEDGDVVVAKITPCFENGKGALAAGLEKGIAFGTTELHVLRPNGVEPRWLFYLTRTRDFLQKGEASMYGAGGQKRVPTDFVREFRTPVPPLPTQRAIADFLDRKTAAIDGLIAKKQKLLDLLAEKRTALINRAVTKGLDPDVPMKDSGVPTLGSVPVHWRVTRNKNVISERTQLSESGEEELLSVSHLTGVTPRSQKEVTMFMAASHEGYKLVQPGDLVINTLWAWMGALGTTDFAGIVSPAYGVYEIDRTKLLPGFADLFFRNPAYVVEMTRHSRGVWSSRLRLYPESFLGLLICLPPLSEQHAIVEFVAREVGSFGTAISKLEASVKKLQEYRQALITAAVTGQIDVEAA